MLHLNLQEAASEGRYIAQETNSSDQGPSVTVSVRGDPHSMTVYEVSKIEVPEFAALWTVSTPGSALNTTKRSISACGPPQHDCVRSQQD